MILYSFFFLLNCYSLVSKEKIYDGWEKFRLFVEGINFTQRRGATSTEIPFIYWKRIRLPPLTGTTRHRQAPAGTGRHWQASESTESQWQVFAADAVRQKYRQVPASNDRHRKHRQTSGGTEGPTVAVPDRYQKILAGNDGDAPLGTGLYE